MDVQALSDEELTALWRAVEFEHGVRGEMRRMLEPVPCGVIWGPGPPYYCVPKCKVNIKGHPGRCVPDKTKDECRDAYYESSRTFFDGVNIERAEAVHRLEAQGYVIESSNG